tara:strand:- start:498 stop:1199 length:702 start_codon:yes stop_codon:yes gene_type:complete
MVKLSKRDLTIIAGVLGAIDFAYEGALTKPVSRAVKTALRAGAAKLFLNPGQIPTNTQLAKGIGRAVGRQAVRLPGTALAVGRTIAMRHPYLTAGAIIYYTVKNRDDIERIVRDGYEVLEDINAPMAERRREFASDPIGFTQDIFEDRPLIRPLGAPIPGLKPKRRKSKFNKAVSAGMKVVKASTSYGKKGTISNAKKAFAAVTKTASKINKGAKVAKSGITRKIGLAAKRIL